LVRLAAGPDPGVPYFPDRPRAAREARLRRDDTGVAREDLRTERSPGLRCHACRAQGSAGARPALHDLRAQDAPRVPAAARAGPRLAELADFVLEDRPGGCAELLLPALVEAAAELGAEARHVGIVEDQAALREPLAQLAVEVVGIGALRRDVLLHVALDDLLDLLRQRVPEAQIREQVEARPHVVRDRDVARDLVQFVHLDDDQRVLLAV